MTVASSTSRVTYAGNGSTVTFTVPFYFLANTHIKVVLLSASGIETTKTLTTDYTVSGAGTPSGGSITMIVAPASGETLSILRNVPYTQETDYQSNDPFPAETHERALDKLTMETQQLAEQANRALTLPPSLSGGNTTLPAPESNALIGWNSSLTGLQNVSPLTLVTQVTYGTAKADIFNGDGTTTQFTLTASPGAQNNLDVSISGVTQKPGIDYTWVSGTTITFASAPPVGTNNVLCRYLQALPQNASDSAASTFIQSGTSAVTRNAQDKMREFVSVKDFGAVGDGVTDDTAAIQAAVNSLVALGGTVVIPNGMKCLIDNNLTIQASVHLVGPHQFVGYNSTNLYALAPYANMGGALIINSANTISIRSGASIRGFLIYRKGMTFPAPDSSAFAGTAITYAGDDAVVERCMIMGFNKAIYSSGYQRPKIEHLLHDNVNGIEITNCLDIAYINKCHAWPFATLATGGAHGTLERSGIAYSIHDLVDWAKLTDCFSFGYFRGYKINNANSVTLTSCGADNPYSGTPLHVGSIGFEIAGTSAETRLIGCQAAAQDTAGVYVNTSGSYTTQIVGSNFWSIASHGVLVAAGDVHISGATNFRNIANGVSVTSATSRVFIDRSIRFQSVTLPLNIVVSTSLIDFQYCDMSTLGAGVAAAGANMICQSVASASPLSLPPGEIFNITGTTNFGSLLGGYAGRTVTLIFAGALQVFSGTGATTNMKLNAGATFVTAANSTLTLRHNGVQWFEIGRCA